MASPSDPHSPPSAAPDAVATTGKRPWTVLAAACLFLLYGAVSEYGAFFLYPNATLGLTGRLVVLVIFSCLAVFVSGALYQGRAWARSLTLILGAILLAWLPWRLTNLPPSHVVAFCARTFLLVLASALLLFRSARDWFRHHSFARAKRSRIPKSYPPKVRAALEMLAAAGIARSNTPPIYRLLWRLGFDVPPPYFAGFLSNCANTGIAFGVIAWVCLLVRFNAPPERVPQFLEFSAVAGLMVGVSMAVYFRHRATKYRLPPWSSLPDGPTPKWSHAVATRLITFGRPVIYLLAAVFMSFKLGLFAPGLAQVKGTSIEETPLVDMAGHKHSFHELRGQATTIYFWATWCGPCLSHMSDLANGQRLPANEPFLPVAVEEDPKAVTAMLKRLGYHGAVWAATDGQTLLLRRFAGNDKRAIPFVVKLDAAGKILEARYGDSAVIAKDPVKMCRNDDNEDAKPRVAACTTLISKGASEEDISDAYWHRALAYSLLNDYKSALADLDAVILRQPNNAKALAERGNVHEHMGDHDLAIADLERSIQLDGGSYAAFGNLGDAYRAKRDFDRAEVSYGHAIDMGKGYTGAWTYRCFTRAIIGKDLGAALADCNAAMKLTSKEPHSLENVLSYRCFAQYRMKHYREAAQDCDAAIAHGATFASAFYMRGLAKRALGDTSASDDIDHARKIAPGIAERYAGYGVPETP